MRRGLTRLVLFLAMLVLASGVGALPGARAGITLAQTAGALDQARSADAGINFDAIARRAAELRGLAPRQEVARTVLTPEQLHAQLVDEMSDAESRDAIEHSRRLMVALGLLGPDVDLYALELGFRSGVVLGQYDPDTKELYIISGADNPGPLEQVTFAHEYTHALQDQNYDIRALMPKHSDNSDRDLAASALLEGDALIMEEIYQAQAMTRAQRDEKRRQERSLSNGLDLDRVPLVMQEETYFPYVEGPRFILRVAGENAVRQALETGTGYGPAVNRIFEHPPTSTAQILHPEKYLNGTEPVSVSFPDLAAALGPGWQQLEKDVLGEIDHRILIQQFLNREIADRAADGWAGDAYALLGNGDQVAVVVSSRWDSAADASEWFDAYSQAMRARYGAQLVAVDERPDRVVWRTPDGMQALKRSGTITMILVASTADQIGNLERALDQAG